MKKKIKTWNEKNSNHSSLYSDIIHSIYLSDTLRSIYFVTEKKYKNNFIFVFHHKLLSTDPKNAKEIILIYLPTYLFSQCKKRKKINYRLLLFNILNKMFLPIIWRCHQKLKLNIFAFLLLAECSTIYVWSVIRKIE